MKKKIVILSIFTLFLTILYAGIIELKDNNAKRELYSESNALRWFNEQIKLNSETVLSFSKGEVSKETVSVSVSSLRNIYYLYISNIFELDLNETERFKEINDLFITYWGLTTFTDSISAKDLSDMQNLEKEFSQFEVEISNEINDMVEKQRNYWWGPIFN